MSAIGIWNNRYEGGPCYAACMETFTLYFYFYPVTILQFNIAGEAVTMVQEELMTLKAEIKHPKCANDTQQNQCSQELVNLKASKI